MKLAKRYHSAYSKKRSNANEVEKKEVTVRNDEDQEKKIEDWRGKEDEEVVKDKETDDSKVQVDPVPTVHERCIRKD